MKIYVAGASSEIDRAEAMIARLKSAGFEVTCTWPETVRNVGHANPADATHEQRAKWAMTDLEEVRICDAFWFLLPSKGHSTAGAWAELGYAYAMNKYIGLSGSSSNVFVGLGSIYSSDEAAFAALVALRDLPDSEIPL